VAKCCKGQSLVEVVIAVGAMSVLLVALLSLMSLSLRNSRLAKDRARAVASASQGVELMRAYAIITERILAKANAQYNTVNWGRGRFECCLRGGN
jgi:Tfp pilus assembly protein PilV